MKIVMICDFYDESLLYQDNLLAEQYVKLGHDVTVVASTVEAIFDFIADKYDSSRPGKTTFAKGIKIVRRPYQINLLNRIRRFSGLRQLFESESPDLIFFHETMFNLIDGVRYVRTHPKTRMIMDCHADYSNSGKNWLSRRILHKVLRGTALNAARPYLRRIFPITPATGKFLSELYGVRPDEMELLPLGTDLDLAGEVYRSDAVERIRRKHGIGNGSFVVFTGGKLAPPKRTELLIEAFKALAADESWLVIAGDSPADTTAYKKKLVMLADGHPRIVFTGWLDTRQLLEHIAVADIAVFPSSQSVLWQQAIGMGKPLVIGEPRARQNGNQDATYLNPYGNVVITNEPFASAKWLLDTMRHLLAHPDERKRMAEGARRTARELLDWKIIAERTLDC